MTPEARRIEELGLNSSAPPGQLLYDGWLLRMLPGKAKRARSVNAVYPSTRELGTKIAYCERLYRGVGLPTLFRITPFSQPDDLDAVLERRGYGRFDTTAVEAAALDPAMFADAAAERIDIADCVEAAGRMRGTSSDQRAAHRARLAATPLAIRAVAIREEGRIVATGLTIIEDDWAGLFDIITREDSRNRGHARSVVAALLRSAWELGARNAYLQVKEDNVPARRIYTQFGFSERYVYWYRARSGEQE
jgi:ribosomal protein S18 acetylase RimI-like enzyme